MEVRDHLHYTKEHEWVTVEDKIATVGLTDYAQDALGDVTFVELPDIGMEAEQFEQLASIESVKAASDIYSPLSGRVVEVNHELDSNPDLINKSCYDMGWVAKLEIASEDEMSKLMDAEEYQTYLEGLE